METKWVVFCQSMPQAHKLKRIYVDHLFLIQINVCPLCAVHVWLRFRNSYPNVQLSCWHYLKMCLAVFLTLGSFAFLMIFYGILL